MHQNEINKIYLHYELETVRRNNSIYISFYKGNCMQILRPNSLSLTFTLSISKEIKIHRVQILWMTSKMVLCPIALATFVCILIYWLSASSKCQHKSLQVNLNEPKRIPVERKLKIESWTRKIADQILSFVAFDTNIQTRDTIWLTFLFERIVYIYTESPLLFLS